MKVGDILVSPRHSAAIHFDLCAPKLKILKQVLDIIIHAGMDRENGVWSLIKNKRPPFQVSKVYSLENWNFLPNIVVHVNNW